MTIKQISLALSRFIFSLSLFAVISRGSSPGLTTTSNPPPRQDQLYSRINKSNSASSGLKEVMDSSSLQEASLTWLQKQQRKLEERRAAQRRREGHFTSTESSLMRELKTSLDRARSETTTDGYAASETASLMFSETSRESSPHKSRIVPIQLENNGFGHQQPQRTSTPKSRPSQQPPNTEQQTNLTRHVSDTSYDRSRPLIQRRLRYDSEGEQSLNGHVIHSAASNTSIDSINSRPITPGFPTVPPTPIFGQPAISTTGYYKP